MGNLYRPYPMDIERITDENEACDIKTFDMVWLIN